MQKTLNDFSSTVIKLAYIKNNRSFYTCLCSCGNEFVRRSDQISKQSTCNSCKAEKQKIRMTKHGQKDTHLYKEWAAIKSRCYYQKNKSYSCYGGRGIEMCDEWKNDFEAFKKYVSNLEHFGEKSYTLDRIDVNGNYAPNNVRWATSKEQLNNKRETIYLTLNGTTKPLMFWSEELNIHPNTLRNRLKMGWSDERTLTYPVEKHRRAI